MFSYHSSRNRTGVSVGRENIHNTKAKNKSQLMYHLPVVLTVAVIVGSLAYLSTLTASPKITPYVNATPNLLQEDGVYLSAATEILNSSPLNRSKLTIDTDRVALRLKQQFPELSEVTVIMPLAGRRPIIEIQPADPVLTIAAESGVYVLDSDGRAVMNARKTPAALIDGLPLLRDETGAPVELGKLALTRDMVSYVRNIDEQLKNAEIDVESMTLPAIPHELHLRVKGERYYVKFHTLGDARLQSGAYLAVRDDLLKNNHAPTEYIDVRLEDKVYYR